MRTPILETERMILRPLSTADAETIFERWTSDPRVARYVRWCTHKSVAETRQWLEQEEAAIDGGTGYQWGFVRREDNFLFGSGGLEYNEEERVFELGYNIMHRFWNMGYTTEAAKAILKFAGERLSQNEFVAWHAAENPASGAVMRKCGFQYEADGMRAKFDGVTTYAAKLYRLKQEW